MVLRTKLTISLLLGFMFSTANAQIDPTIGNWLINTTGATGTSVDPDIDAEISQVLADVESVHYSDDAVYVQTSGRPFDNPIIHSDLDATYVVTRNPVASSGENTAVRLGHIGVLLNGVSIYNYADGMSYNSQGIWNQDANFFEAESFDNAPGHPSSIFSAGGGGPPGGGGDGGGPTDGGDGGGPPGGQADGGHYHHHQNPQALRELLGDDGSAHSPLLGFAIDGFPIYGPFGYADPGDSSSEVVRVESSYRMRDITERTALADGTALEAALFGPTLEEISLGAYQEDFEFVDGFGHLDEHNGRLAITPDYPDGTYAYYVTLDENGDSAFPHIIGSSYYGETVSQQDVVVPAGATQFVPEPNAFGLLGMGSLLLGFFRRRR
jgi:hypothetical protein